MMRKLNVYLQPNFEISDKDIDGDGILNQYDDDNNHFDWDMDEYQTMKMMMTITMVS